MKDNETISEPDDILMSSLDKFKNEVAHVKRPQVTSYYYVHNINIFSKYNGFE